jgi:hypothetical protein
LVSQLTVLSCHGCLCSGVCRCIECENIIFRFCSLACDDDLWAMTVIRLEIGRWIAAELHGSHGEVFRGLQDDDTTPLL